MKWQPSLVFLPGKSHRQRSLVGYSPWGHKRITLFKAEWLNNTVYGISILWSLSQLSREIRNNVLCFVLFCLSCEHIRYHTRNKFLRQHLQWTYQGFPDSSVGTESACNAGDPSSIPGSGRSAGEGIGSPLQYSWASLVAQLVKNSPAMWETWVPIPGLGRSPGGGIGYPLQYSWASLVARLVKNPSAMWETWVWKIPWMRAWKHTPVFLPAESAWTDEPGGL